MNNELKFAVWRVDLPAILDYLDAEINPYTYKIKGRIAIIIVDVSHDPGKAGRSFDIGRAIGKLEIEQVKSIHSL